MSIEAVESLAKLVKEAAKLHEESGISKEKTHLGDYQMNMSIQDAAWKACGNALWFPIYLLLNETWNDALDWAESTERYENLGLKTTEEKPVHNYISNGFGSYWSNELGWVESKADATYFTDEEI